MIKLLINAKYLLIVVLSCLLARVLFYTGIGLYFHVFIDQHPKFYIVYEFLGFCLDPFSPDVT